MNSEIREGMPVVDATGHRIGQVESLTAEHFFVTRTSLVETRIVANRDEVEDVVDGEVHLRVDRETLLAAHRRPPGDESSVQVSPHQPGVEQLQSGDEDRRNLDQDDVPEARH
jgi:hypothetical protein